MKRIFFILSAFLLLIPVIDAETTVDMICFNDSTLCVDSEDVHSASQDDFGTLISKGNSYVKLIDTTFSDVNIQKSLTLELSGENTINYFYINGADLRVTIVGDGILKTKELSIYLGGSEIVHTATTSDFSALNTYLLGDYTVEVVGDDIVIKGTKAVEKVTLAKPSLTETYYGNGQVVLDINTTDLEYGCQIYRSTSKNGKYQRLESRDACTDGSYIAEPIVGKTYYYKVRTYIKDIEGTTYSEYSEPIAIKASLDSPVPTVTSKDKTSLVVRWDKVEGATGYQVYRATSKTGKYTLVKTASGVSYTDTKLTTGKRYYYKVRAYKTVESTKGYSPYSAIISEIPRVAKPEFTANSYSYNSNKIVINKVSGASGYEIYRSIERDSGYELVTRTTKTTYYDKSLATGTTYYYKVKAYATVNGSRKYSDESDILESIPVPAAPTFKINNTLNSNYLQIEIDKVSGASGYEIYKYNGTEYVSLGTTEDLTFIDEAVTYGVEYSYKVVAYRNVESVSIAGKESDPKSVMVKPQILTLNITNNGYTTQTVSMTYDEGLYVGDVYKVYLYRSTSKTGKYEKVYEGTDFEFTDSKLKFNTSYYYKAIIEKNGVQSEYSLVYGKKTALPKTVVSTKTSSKTALKLSWDKVTGASGYQVYRATSKNGKYTLVKTTTSTSYTDSKLTTGKRYYYKVRAYRTVSKKKVYGSYSDIVNDIPRVTKPKYTVSSYAYDTNKIVITKVSGASGYEIYRSTKPDSDYTLVTRTTKTTYYDKKLETGIEYYYKVRAYATVKGSRKYGDESAIYSSIPAPAAPTFTINNKLSADYLQLNINQVAGADKYFIYRYNGTEYALLGSTEELTYIDRDVILGNEYLYKVVATRKVEGENYPGQESKVVSATVKPRILTLSVANNSYNSNIITMSIDEEVKPEEDNKLYLYRSTSKTGKYTLVCEGYSIQCIDSGLSFNKTYYYKAVIEREGVKSEDSLIYSKKTALTKPTVTAKSSSKTSIKVSWNKVSGASGYQVYRATSKTGKYTLVKTTTSTSYTNSSLTTGKTYYYKVRAYRTVSGKKVYGTYSTVVSDTAKVGTPVVIATDNDYQSNKLIWNKVSGVSGYEISRSTSIDGEYEVLGTTTKTTYYDNSLETSITYYYKVRAYATVSGSKKYGNYSEVVSATPMLDTPSLSVKKVGKNYVTLQVSPVEGATSYDVYVKSSEGDVVIGTVTPDNMEITDTNVTLGQEYSYYVIAEIDIEHNLSYSEASEIVTAEVLPVSPTIEVTRKSETAQTINVNIPDFDLNDSPKLTIFRAMNGGDYEEVYSGNVTSENFTYDFEDIQVGNTYTYSAVVEINSIKSDASETQSLTATYDAKALMVIINSQNLNYIDAYIPLESGETLSGIEVYRSKTVDGTYSLVGESEYNYYDKISAHWGDTYYYKARYYHIIDDVKVYSEYSSPVSYKPTLTGLDTYPLEYEDTNYKITLNEASFDLVKKSGDELTFDVTLNIASSEATSASQVEVKVEFWPSLGSDPSDLPTLTFVIDIPIGENENYISTTKRITIPEYFSQYQLYITNVTE